MFSPNRNTQYTTIDHDETAHKGAVSSQNPRTYHDLNVIRKLSKTKFPIYLASSKIDRQYYAMKVFPYAEENCSENFKNEIRFASLEHPNIINMIYAEDKRDTIRKGELKRVSYILMEYAPYGDFFDFITRYRDQIDDKLARTYFKQLIEGVEYLHSNGIAHLDLKPENLLLGSDFNLKIIDFDLSFIYGDTKVLSNGTKYYRGPEFFRSGSSNTGLKLPFAADIFSAGTILFILKSGGIYPQAEDDVFDGINFTDLMYRDNRRFWTYHCEIEDRKSSFYDHSFKELFNSMVNVDPEKRVTIRQIKQSKWYKGPVYTPQELQEKMRRLFNC